MVNKWKKIVGVEVVVIPRRHILIPEFHFGSLHHSLAGILNTIKTSNFIKDPACFPPFMRSSTFYATLDLIFFISSCTHIFSVSSNGMGQLPMSCNIWITLAINGTRIYGSTLVTWPTLALPSEPLKPTHLKMWEEQPPHCPSNLHFF